MIYLITDVRWPILTPHDFVGYVEAPDTIEMLERVVDRLVERGDIDPTNQTYRSDYEDGLPVVYIDEVASFHADELEQL